MPVDNGDIYFFKFAIAKSKIFLILNQPEYYHNFAINLWNNQKQKWKLMKYNESEQNQSIILWNIVRCHEISLKNHLVLEKTEIFC